MEWPCEAVAILWKHAQNWTTQKEGKNASRTQERICARAQVRGFKTPTTSACLKHSNFLKLIKRIVSPTAVHMKPFSTMEHS